MVFCIVLAALVALSVGRTHYHRAAGTGVALPCGVNSCPAAAQRRQQAFDMRVQRAFADLLTFPCQTPNGDEQLYASTRAGSYSKGLQHDLTTGIVNATAFQLFLAAVASNNFVDVPMGGARKFTSPMSGLMFELIGGDSASFAAAPAPKFASAEAAGEIVELYWAALARDIPFEQYASSPLIAEAVADLNRLSDYRGIKPVTAANIFRGIVPGAADGPFISQFFYTDVNFGANAIDMRVKIAEPDRNYMTNWNEFVRIQNGANPSESEVSLPGLRYILNMRDLTHWVHVDVLFQAYFESMLYLQQINAPLKSDLPYSSESVYYGTQEGFATYGAPFFAATLSSASMNALQAAWYQKWFVHRRIRPEAFAGRVDRTKNGVFNFPLHADVLNSSVLPKLFAKYSSYLLPMAFPEGSPMHPSYVAGHATVAGACTTILKAFFEESTPFPNPVVPSADGSSRVPYVGPPLTVGGELNKIATNVAYGRNFAGVHWRSDAVESLKLGEQVAIAILRDIKSTAPESFPGFRFKSFAGQDVLVQ